MMRPLLCLCGGLLGAALHAAVAAGAPPTSAETYTFNITFMGNEVWRARLALVPPVTGGAPITGVIQTEAHGVGTVRRETRSLLIDSQHLLTLRFVSQANDASRPRQTVTITQPAGGEPGLVHVQVEHGGRKLAPSSEPLQAPLRDPIAALLALREAILTGRLRPGGCLQMQAIEESKVYDVKVQFLDYAPYPKSPEPRLVHLRYRATFPDRSLSRAGEMWLGLEPRLDLRRIEGHFRGTRSVFEQTSSNAAPPLRAPGPLLGIDDCKGATL